MRKKLQSAGFIGLGLLGLLALLCSLAASCIVNPGWISQGFSQYADTAHLGVGADAYPAYARGLAQYLDGKTAAVQAPDPLDASRTVNAFSDKENRHLADVRGIVRFLKGMRWVAGGLTIALIAGLYLWKRKDTAPITLQLVRGFAFGAMVLLGAALALCLWGLLNFRGLFWCFHQVAFSNDLWLLDPQTDLLVALMPLEFFTWYAGQLLKSMLPVLGMMLCLIIAWFRLRGEEKTAPSNE